jgi:ferric-dicitrate binding protein FerR (iron transport regulator)
MSDRPENIKQRLISVEAADWLLRLRDGRLSDRQEYVRWLKQSPLHVREMLELASLEGLLRNADLTGISPASHDSSNDDSNDDFGAPDATAAVVELVSRPQQIKKPPADARRSPWRHWRSAASACLSRIGFARRAISRFVGIGG